MSRSRRGRWWRLGLGILLVGASGCAAWMVPVVAAGWPIIAPSPARRGPVTTEPRVVADEGRGWERVLVDSAGRVIDLGPTGPAQVGVRWRIPLEVTGEIQAIVGLASRNCQMDPGPRSWQLRSTSGVRSVGELWLAPERQVPSLHRADQRTLAPGALEPVRARTGLSPITPLRWLAIVPGTGRYWVDLVWDPLPPVRAEQIRPCLESWLPVPLAEAMMATQGSGIEPRADTAGDADAPTSTDRAAGTRAASPGDTTWYAALRTTLGLLRQPAYDLVRLHQAALDLDIVPAGPPRSWGERVPAGTEAEVPRVLQRWRLEALDALRRGPVASQVALCDLVAQGLAARPLRIWQDEATVPPSDARSCRASR